ncbi:MAG: DUF4403 family protein [Chitinophagaceae bacterium]|nr:DUF4403 family protein [Chitinophagaceae bacterium]
MKPVSFVALLFLCTVFTACSKKLIPEKPALGKTNFITDSLPVSEIDIPLSINLKPFYGIIDKNVQTIYTSEGWPNEFVVDNCDTRYMYRFKRGPLRISSTGNAFNFNFTGSYIIAGSQRACTGSGSNRVPVTPWSPTCTCGLNEAEPRVDIGYRILLSLKNNYNIVTSMRSLEPKAIDKCTVCFWGQDITPTVIKQLKEQLDIAGKDIQDSLNKLSLRPQFQQLWDILNTSIRMYDAGYLQINPEKLRLSTLYVKNDTLNISIGISARPLASLSKPTDYKTVVPDISDFSQRKGFSIYVDAIMNYDSLSNLLTSQLYKKRIDMEKVGKYIIVEKCDIYGEGNEKLIIKIQFSGPDKGVLYLTGKPVFDKEKNQLQVKNIDYDIKTRDMLVTTAKWLFNKRIINELNKYSTFNIQDYTDTLLQKINDQINREWKKGIFSSGNVTSLQIAGIYPLADHLVLRCNTKGELSLKIDALELSL